MHGISRRDLIPASDAATNSAQLPTEIERSATRNIQTRIIPFVFVLFVIAFIDRITSALRH